MFTSPIQNLPNPAPSLHLRGLGAWQPPRTSEEGAVMAMEVQRGLAPLSTALTCWSPWQRAPLARQGSHASLPRETELAEKVFFPRRGWL